MPHGLLLLLSLLISFPSFGLTPEKKTLPIGFAPSERGRALESARETEPPKGEIRSLAEWEDADAVMTLWPNPSLISSLVKHAPVKLFSDTRGDETWWRNWLQENQIPSDRISFFAVPTDSIWIRDYGPWPILDGEGHFGLVHSTYNRPRPQDNQVAGFLSKALGLPLYDTGLVHTGGNYYSDGWGDAFSSTLIYSENNGFSEDEVRSRMKSYLGIQKYTTSPLGQGITIEHLDTFGKLVSPDTWVFSEFPEGTSFHDDAEKMVEALKTSTSAYGTPYRIFRLKMVAMPGRSGEYRAYLNSFISNGALYFPTYGDIADDQTKEIYQKALPRFEIIGVDAMGTEWGDSVHCRTRNLVKQKTIFIFPTVNPQTAKEASTVTAEIYPSPGDPSQSRPGYTGKSAERPVRAWTWRKPASGPIGRLCLRSRWERGSRSTSRLRTRLASGSRRPSLDG